MSSQHDCESFHLEAPDMMSDVGGPVRVIDGDERRMMSCDKRESGHLAATDYDESDWSDDEGGDPLTESDFGDFQDFRDMAALGAALDDERREEQEREIAMKQAETDTIRQKIQFLLTQTKDVFVGVHTTSLGDLANKVMMTEPEKREMALLKVLPEIAPFARAKFVYDLGYHPDSGFSGIRTKGGVRMLQKGAASRKSDAVTPWMGGRHKTGLKWPGMRTDPVPADRGSDKDFWVVPTPNTSRRQSSPPPLEKATQATVRQWIYHLRDKVGDRPSGGKEMAIFGSSAVQTLFTTRTFSTMHPRVYADLVRGAKVWWGSRNHVPSVPSALPPPPKIKGLVTPLYLAGVPTSEAELRSLPALWNSDKPRMEVVWRFYKGEELLHSVAQVSLDLVVNKKLAKKSLFINKRDVKTPRDLVRSGLTPPQVAKVAPFFEKAATPRQRLDAFLAATVTVKYQGRESFTFDGYEEESDDPPLQTLTGEIQSQPVARGYFQLISEAIPLEYRKILKRTLRVVVTTGQLYRAESVVDVGLAISQFLLMVPLDYLHGTTTDLVSEFTAQTELVEYMGFSEVKDKVVAAFSSLWEAFVIGLTGCVVSDFFPSLGANIIEGVKAFGSSLSRVAGVTSDSFKREGLRILGSKMATAAYEMLARVIDIIGECIRLRSFEPIYTRPRPADWKLEADVLLTYESVLCVTPGVSPDTSMVQDLRTKGVLPSWISPMPSVTFAENIHRLIQAAPQVRRLCPPSLVRDVDAVVARLHAWVAQNASICDNARLRVEPMGIFFHGAPHTGKTEIANKLYLSLGDHEKFPTTPECLCSWQIANFQDTFTSSAWAVVFDDIDAAPVALGQEPNVFSDVINLGNVKPCSVEQAAVEKKGKVFAKPLLMLWSGNVENTVQPNALRDQQAFWRRWHWKVKVSPKPEYARGTALDGDKARAAKTANVYHLEVSQYDPSAPGNYREPQVMELTDFFVLMREKFSEHLNKGRRRIQELASERCRRCGLPISDNCSCGHLALQGKETAVTASLSVLGSFALYAMYRNVRDRLNGLAVMTEDIRMMARHVRLTSQNLRVAVSGAQLTVEQFKERWSYACSFVPSALQGAAIAVVLGAVVLWKTQVFQARERNAVADYVEKGWVRPDQTFRPGMLQKPATHTYEDIVKQAEQNYGFVAAGRLRTRCVALAASLVLVPRHVLTLDHDPSTVGLHEVAEFTFGTMVHHVRLDAHSVFTIGFDACVVRVSLPALSGMYKKFWMARDEQVSQFDELIYLIPRGDKGAVVEVHTVSHKVYYEPMYGYSPLNIKFKEGEEPKDGDCGSLLVAKTGLGWFVVGFHNRVITSLVSQVFGGTFVTVADFERAAHALGTLLQGCAPCNLQLSRTPSEVKWYQYPQKSEVYVAMSPPYQVPFMALGTIDPPIHGATMKSKVGPTIFADDFRDLEEEWCGEKHYWVSPRFKGAMVDGVWKSPYITSMTPFTAPPVRHEYLWLALADYLAPLKHMDPTGWGEISQEEAIRGIPCSYIQAADMKTSVGPPFNRAKSAHIRILEDGVVLDPQWQSHYKEVQQLVQEGYIPVVVVLCTYKDEPMTRVKAEALRCRIFGCLPFAYNVSAKRFNGPIQSFMRAYKDVFEAMVGINMTSFQADWLVRGYLLRNPNIRGFLNTDFTNQDKGMIPFRLDLVIVAVTLIGMFIGLPRDEVHAINQSARVAVYVVKNDAYSMGGGNPSGGDGTIMFNCIDNSLTQRYLYYRMKYPDGLPDMLRELVVDYQRTLWARRGFVSDELAQHTTFRNDIALATFGDDANQAVGSQCKFYDPAKMTTLAKEIGATITDSNKRDTVAFMQLSEIDFLKRKFVFDEELRMFVPPISLKTIAKMLVIRTQSTLSEKDHASEILSNVARESVYHGKEFFERMRVRIVSAAEKYSLTENSHYRVLTWDEYRQQIKDGAFSTYKMQGADISAKVTNGSPAVSMTAPMTMGLDSMKDSPGHEVVQNTTFVEENTFESEGSQRSAGWRPLAVLKDREELGDFLSRPTLIQSFDLLSTNTPGVALTSVSPVSTWAANADVASKLKNYTYLCGDLMLRFEVTVPTGCRGRYIVCAYPTYGNAGIKIPNYHVMSQMDHCELISGSKSNSFEFRLEYTHFHDYYDLRSGVSSTDVGGLNTWRYRVVCLDPLVQANGSVTPVGTVKVYAWLAPGYDLAVTRYQGKKTFDSKRDEVNSKVKSMTGGMKASEVATAASGFAEKLSGVPVIGTFAKPVAVGAAMVGKVLDFFGFTRAAEQQTPTVVVPRIFSNTANMDVNDTSEISALSNVNSISIDPTLVNADPTDVSACDALYNRWTLIRTFPWSTTDTSGTNIQEIPVTPFIGEGSLVTGLAMPVAGYVGLPFKYWRADMEYKMIVSFSSFDRGSLQIFWSPASADGGGGSSVAQKNLIVDVMPDQEITFDVGYGCPLAMLPSFIYPLPFAGIWSSRGANGRVQIRVHTPLKVTNGSGTVQIHLFARAKNVTFAVPKLIESQMFDNSVPTERVFKYSYVLQGKAIGDDPETEVGGVLMKSTAYPVVDVCAGETFASVRALMQKFTRTQLPSVCTSNGGLVATHFESGPKSFQFDGYQGNPLWDGVDLSEFSWFGWYSAMFLGVAGSARWKIVNGSDGIAFASACPFPATTYGASLDNLSVSDVDAGWAVPSAGAVEITVPYAFPQKFLPTARGLVTEIPVSTTVQQLDRVLIQDANNYPTKVPNAMYRAGGPDLRIIKFVCTPVVKTSGAIETWALSNYFMTAYDPAPGLMKTIPETEDFDDEILDARAPADGANFVDE